jgi:mono/diheme cytochrome c family protein
MVTNNLFRNGLVLSGLFFMTACHRDMVVQPYKKPLETSPFFTDGSASRPIEPHTVSREETAAPPMTGFQDATNLMADIPIPITPQLMAHGRDEFNINCSVCHGTDGYGQGMIVKRGFPAPPSFHTDRLRSAPAGHFFDVITHGYGVMYPFASRISPNDRWAITAYIRALQVSQKIPTNALPPDLLSKVTASGGK